jgi:hypothetical protein
MTPGRDSNPRSTYWFFYFRARTWATASRSTTSRPPSRRSSARCPVYEIPFRPGWLGTDVMIFKIFLSKNLAKILAFFAQITASFCKKFDHNIGFWEKRQFFCRKLAKIAEKCDHNIDPRLGEFSPLFT